MPDGVSESAVRHQPSRQLNLQGGYGPMSSSGRCLRSRPRQCLHCSQRPTTTTGPLMALPASARRSRSFAALVAPVLIVVTGVVGVFIGHAAATGQIAPWLEPPQPPRRRSGAVDAQAGGDAARGIVTTVAVLALSRHVGTGQRASTLAERGLAGAA